VLFCAEIEMPTCALEIRPLAFAHSVNMNPMAARR
jgi:hypothetical protein